MKLLSVITTAALATVSFLVATASAGFASYHCDGGKSLNVMYDFDRNGCAVTTDVNASDKKASLVVDKERSDGTGITFTNRHGYIISAGFINKNTRTTSEVVGVNTPNGSFLVRNYESRPY